MYPGSTGCRMSRGDSTREPVLDGVRGLAILVVIFHHVVIYSGLAKKPFVDGALFALGSASWVGVDLFFVLSGFLITGILYDARSSPNYFFTFYGRRVLRIFPLYYGFLALTFFVVPFWLEPTTAESLTSQQAWYWAYLSNVDVALHGWQEPGYLGHFWSLAVEEQFYLVWPFVVLACDRRQLLRITVICFVGALGLRLLLMQSSLSPLAPYVLMPARMDSLAAGAFLAMVARGPGGLATLGRWPQWVLLGAASSAAAILLWRGGFREADPIVASIGFSIVAAGFASGLALALCLRAKSVWHGVVCSTPLLVLGQYSYGLYVFHQPVMLLLRDLGLQADTVPHLFGSQVPGVLVYGVVAALLSMACALVSWHLWEVPFLRLKRFLRYDRKGAAITRWFTRGRPA